MRPPRPVRLRDAPPQPMTPIACPPPVPTRRGGPRAEVALPRRIFVHPASPPERRVLNQHAAEQEDDKESTLRIARGVGAIRAACVQSAGSDCQVPPSCQPS